MAIPKEVHRLATALLAAGLAFVAAALVSVAQAGSLQAEGLDAARVHIDNDLFAGRDRDRDYTGGLAITISGASAQSSWLSSDPWLGRLDAALGVQDADARVHHARQVGLMVFTPGDILAQAPVRDDRPYANLLFVSNGRVYVEDERVAWSSSLTIGVLGLPLASDLHRAVHDVMGSDRPQGYEHQISAGGEPTARYTLARHHLWIADPSGALDVKTTVQASVGYLTETSAAVSMRVGRFHSAWWSFAPELADYIAAPVPVDQSVGAGAPGEVYFFAGARLKARAYNAFLQGQWRDSEVRYSYAEIEPVVAHAWIGAVTQVFDRTQLSYTLNYQTAELREGAGARSSLWGGVQLAHVF